MKPKSRTMYAAIRRPQDGGPDWIDLDTIAYSMDGAMYRMVEINLRLTAEWAADNPVVRIGELEIVEKE